MHNLFQKTEAERIFPKLFYKAGITLIEKPVGHDKKTINLYLSLTYMQNPQKNNANHLSQF